MTEEVPKNHSFLKFIVIFMGILIALGLVVMVWKVIDLAKQRAARQEQQLVAVEKKPDKAFDVEVTLEPGEKILEISPAPNGLWIRIGGKDRTSRVILVSRTGKTIGTITVKRDNEDVTPVQ